MSENQAEPDLKQAESAEKPAEKAETKAESVTLLSSQEKNKERNRRYYLKHKAERLNSAESEAENSDQEPEIEYIPPKKTRKLRRKAESKADSGPNFSKYLMLAGSLGIAGLLLFIILRKQTGNSAPISDSGNSDPYSHI